MTVDDARARSERSGAAFGIGAPAGSVLIRDATQIQCRVYTPVPDASASLPRTLLMYAAAILL